MDALQGMRPPALSFLTSNSSNIPANLTTTTATVYQLLALYQNLLPYLSPVITSLSNLWSTTYDTLHPFAIVLLNRLAIYAHDSPAVITIAVLLLTLAVAFQILNFARKVVVFWTRLFAKLLLYGVVLVLAMTVYQRGMAATLGDLHAWASEIGEVWTREYSRWEGYQNQQQFGTGKGGRYGTGNAGTGWR